jgi:hypothetical protein
MERNNDEELYRPSHLPTASTEDFGTLRDASLAVRAHATSFAASCRPRACNWPILNNVFFLVNPPCISPGLGPRQPTWLTGIAENVQGCAPRGCDRDILGLENAHCAGHLRPRNALPQPSFFWSCRATCRPGKAL